MFVSENKINQYYKSNRSNNLESMNFAELYEEYGRDLLRYIYSRVQNVEVAEDIVQDLFLSLWKNSDRKDEIVNIRAYLFSGARYLIIAHLHKKNTKTVHIELSDLQLLDKEVSIEDKLHYRYLLDLLYDEIEHLPEKCRLIFVESRFNNKSIREIANIYGISESTVENHINKALGKLRKVRDQYLSIFLYFF